MPIACAIGMVGALVAAALVPASVWLGVTIGRRLEVVDELKALVELEAEEEWQREHKPR
jgi:hypothetical protein